jgi:hypothetical protein
MSPLVRRWRQSEARRSERGVIAVYFALLLVVMLGMVALVLDAAALRADRRASQTVVDMAATAGAMSLYAPLTLNATPHEACLDAWGYFTENAPDAPDVSDPCGVFAGAEACDPSDPIEAIVDADPYEVRILWPVPDGHRLLEGRHDEEIDGSPCDRVGVEVRRTRGFVFAPVLGHTDGATSASAVARVAFDDEQKLVPALVVLDPLGCQTLHARGQAGSAVHVWEGSGGEPGIIVVDSDGVACGPPTRVIRLDGNNVTIKAGVTNDAGDVRSGAIFNYGLLVGTPQNDIYSAARVPGQLIGGDPTPQHPIPGSRSTREAWEHTYDCAGSYPFSLSDPLPHAGIDGCPEAGERPAHISALRSHVDAIVASADRVEAADAAGYEVLTGSECDIQGDVTLDLPDGKSGWWFDCDTLRVRSAGTLEVPDGDVVVRGSLGAGPVQPQENAIDLSGVLRINATGAGDASFVYARRGHFSKGGTAGLALGREDGTAGTFVMLNDGRIEMAGNTAEEFDWFAPYDGDFENLALWSTGTRDHRMTGDVSNLRADGIFYMPNAKFDFGGGGNMSAQRAQFIAYRLEVHGGGALKMVPDPDRHEGISLAGVRLIR